MKKVTILAFVCVLFFQAQCFAGVNCITHDKGVKIIWFGKKGCIEFTQVKNLTSDFKVIVYADNESNVLFSGLPTSGQKVVVPKGVKEVGLKISSGQGEVCYSRGD